jgi:hypothetical protein
MEIKARELSLDPASQEAILMQERVQEGLWSPHLSTELGGVPTVIYRMLRRPRRLVVH